MTNANTNTAFTINRQSIDSFGLLVVPAMQWLISETNATAESAFAAAAEMEEDMVTAYLAARGIAAEPFVMELWMVDNVLCG